MRLPYLLANALALAMYIVSAVMYVRAGMAGTMPQRHARWFAGVGLAVHATAIVAEAVAGEVPGFAESLSALAFGVMLVTAMVSRDRLSSLGMFLVPAATVLQAASFFAPSTQVAALRVSGASWWLPVHLGLVFAAMAGFFLEFIVASLQIVVRRRLKQKRLATLDRFPAIEVLDRVQFRALVFGLACLGLGIAVGAVWASTVMAHGMWITDPKVWTTLAVWGWYAGVLQFRLVRGWHVRFSMVLSGVGFFLLMFSFVGLEFLIEGFHAYGG